MIILENVESGYNDWKVNYDLHIKPQEKVAIVGTSGAGKSTLFNIIAGFLPVTSGKVILNGQDCTNLAVQNRPVSIMFQHNNLFPNLNVKDNIALAFGKLSLNQEQEEKVLEFATYGKIEQLLQKKVEEISGGQQQRVALIRNLLLERPIILMDEPFSSLDEESTERVFALTKEVVEKNKLTLVLITHKLSDVVADMDRIIYIEQGNIVKVVTKAQLQEQA